MKLAEISRLLHAAGIYEGFVPEPMPDYVDGWGSYEPFFAEILREVGERDREPIIVEVGTWLGASAIHMSNLLASMQLGGGVVCVDTWLGALEFWLDTADATRYQALGLRNGYPSVYYNFLSNVVQKGVQDRIVPFPVTSPIAARWFAKAGIRPAAVYIDGSHDAPDVLTDLTSWFPLVEGTGTMFGHDYDWVGPTVDAFAADRGLKVEQAKSSTHWVLR